MQCENTEKHGFDSSAFGNRSKTPQSGLGRVFRPPCRTRKLASTFLRRFSSFAFLAHLPRSRVLRSARRRRRGAYLPGRRASLLGGHGVGAAMDRARVASAAEASRARIEEDLGAGESVSERVGRVFAGYRCGTMTVRLERRARAKGFRNAHSVFAHAESADAMGVRFAKRDHDACRAASRFESVSRHRCRLFLFSRRAAFHRRRPRASRSRDKTRI